jgi:hypothetical protein
MASVQLRMEAQPELRVKPIDFSPPARVASPRASHQKKTLPEPSMAPVELTAAFTVHVRALDRHYAIIGGF